MNAILDQERNAILEECAAITESFLGFGNDGQTTLSNHIAIIGDMQISKEIQTLKSALDDTYQVDLISPLDFSIDGYLGNFKITNSENIKTTYSQVISFVPLNRTFGKGLHIINQYQNQKELISALDLLCGEIEYVENIQYDSTFCQFSGRFSKTREDKYCQECVKTCPSNAIIVENHSLIVSHIDCIACGQCVGVCPSGSMSKKGDTPESLSLKSRLYKGKIPLLITQDSIATNVELINKILQQNPLLTPLILPNLMLLNETYYLILLEESASNIIVFKPKQNAFNTQDFDTRIDNVNLIYKHIYGLEDVISVIDSNTKDLADIQFTQIELSHFIHTPNSHENLKDIFSQRMQFLIKNEHFGKINIKGMGEIKVDRDKCTMCLSCVGACNTSALINDNASFSLQFKSSLCTGCYYCKDFCSENAIEISPDIFALEEKSFRYVEMASDTIFKCVECGQGYASKKSIDKIKSVLSHITDPKILRTLECCADCKIKVMFN